MTEEDGALVLVVDDEESVAEVFALWLDDAYRTRIANDGESALAAMDNDVDAVLLDRRMPGLSGDDVLAEMRDRGFEAPVAMVTAVDPDIDILDMAFDDYLTKPVSKEELHETVERLLSLSGYDSKAQEHFALAKKLGTLEAEKSTDELESSEEYREMRDRLEDLRDEMDDLFAGMDERASSVLLRGLDSDAEE